MTDRREVVRSTVALGHGVGPGPCRAIGPCLDERRLEFLAGRNEVFADLSRNVGPSSAGTVITRNQLRVRWTYALTPRLSLLAGLRGTYDEDVDPVATFQPRRYATGDVGLQWFWQEEFSLRAAYDYTRQEFRNSGNDATSSGAMLTVLYQPQQRRRARND